MSSELGAMGSDSAVQGSGGRRALRTIVTAGLVAGALDITYAFIIWGMRGVTPLRICRSIAAGLVGTDAARAGGAALGTLGLGLHFVMAIIIAAIYFFAARHSPLLVKRAVPCGIAYGLATYGVMNYVVMPLSAIGSTGGGGPAYITITGILVHMFLIGLPIALITRRGMMTQME